MKQTHNRQNKGIQIKAASQAREPRREFASTEPSEAGLEKSGMRRGGSVCGLVFDILVATKIAQMAQRCHYSVHNFDSAERLLGHCRQHIPSLIIIDWERREAEAFKMLKEISSNADFKSVGIVGFTSAKKTTLGEEARRAGCERVWPKTEFMKDLENIFARYAK